MGVEDTVRSFFNQICKIKYELSFAGKTIENEEKKFTVLDGLEDNYLMKKTIVQENVSMSFEETE